MNDPWVESWWAEQNPLTWFGIVVFFVIIILIIVGIIILNLTVDIPKEHY